MEIMASEKLKINYELHYWETNVTGSSENDWESLSIKPIYFPKDGTWGTWKYRVAVGFEWILDAGNDDKGIAREAARGGKRIGFAFHADLETAAQWIFAQQAQDIGTILRAGTREHQPAILEFVTHVA